MGSKVYNDFRDSLESQESGDGRRALTERSAQDEFLTHMQDVRRGHQSAWDSITHMEDSLYAASRAGLLSNARDQTPLDVSSAKATLRQIKVLLNELEKEEGKIFRLGDALSRR